MPPVPSTALIVAALIVLFLLPLSAVALFRAFFPLWMQAAASGAPVRILDLIGMRLRGTDMKAVVRAIIVARQGGVVIAPAEMEKAWIQGADLDKIAKAVLQARKDGLDATFQDIVDVELEDRLVELLRQNEPGRWDERRGEPPVLDRAGAADRRA